MANLFPIPSNARQRYVAYTFPSAANRTVLLDPPVNGGGEILNMTVTTSTAPDAPFTVALTATGGVLATAAQAGAGIQTAVLSSPVIKCAQGTACSLAFAGGATTGGTVTVGVYYLAAQ